MDKYFAYLAHERGLAASSIEVYRRDVTKLTQWVKGTGLNIETLAHNELREFVMTLSYEGRFAECKLVAGAEL